jgi:hypothetical protein
MDEAESRNRKTIRDAAAKLPKHVQHLRSVYPQWVRTATITDLLDDPTKKTTLSALHAAHHRVERRVANNRGDYEWRYKPTYAEGPRFDPKTT